MKTVNHLASDKREICTQSNCHYYVKAHLFPMTEFVDICCSPGLRLIIAPTLLKSVTRLFTVYLSFFRNFSLDKCSASTGLIDLYRIPLQCVGTIAPERGWGRHFPTFAVILSTLTSTKCHCLLECGKALLNKCRFLFPLLLSM